MNKQAPSVGRILAMVVFSFSCLGILLFLWTSFGGPIPLRPKGYEFKVAFPEATTLPDQADVRIAGVSVGKVVKLSLDKGGARTLATIDVKKGFAPIPKDTKAILRQKTLLGETYVELTPGDPKGGSLPDGARLADTQVEPTVELDEILSAFDPSTRKAFRQWIQQSAQTIQGGRGQDLNDALGNLQGFAQDGADVLGVLDQQSADLHNFVKNTGVVFHALTERDGQLRSLVTNSNDVFSATASEQNALSRTFDILPTFEDESKATLAKLQGFSSNADPVVNDLKPVADKLQPTVKDLSVLAPSLETLFKKRLPPLISSRQAEPAERRAHPARRLTADERAAHVLPAAQPDPVVLELLPGSARQLPEHRRLGHALPHRSADRRRSARRAEPVRHHQSALAGDPDHAADAMTAATPTCRRTPTRARRSSA